MNVLSKPVLLVALSAGFNRPSLFVEKMDKITGALPHVEVVLVQDEQGIAADYFSERHIQARNQRASNRMSAKALVDGATHVVVFWGGQDLTDIVYFARLLKKSTRIIPLRITTVRNQTKEEFDISIGRGGPWGNPFKIGHGPGGLTREEVIDKYRDYFEQEILTDPEKHAALLSLRGYRLGCFCKPLACHGDVIASYLNSYVEADDESGED